MHTFLGLIGVFCCLLAYALVQIREFTINSDSYTVLNVISGTCSIYSLSHDFNLAAFIS
uniref:CBU_0592 family membrane protein n=1 Tax=Serratia proteamaculans TaxID=28151 RepID=UPI003B66F711